MLKYWLWTDTCHRPIEPVKEQQRYKTKGRLTWVLSKNLKILILQTLMASFQALLGRYSGQSEVSAGTPVANRTRAEIEPLIGFFVNTLVLRTDLSSQPSFEELLDQLRESALQAYLHQDVPFEQVVEDRHAAGRSTHAHLEGIQ